MKRLQFSTDFLNGLDIPKGEIVKLLLNDSNFTEGLIWNERCPTMPQASGKTIQGDFQIIGRAKFNWHRVKIFGFVDGDNHFLALMWKEEFEISQQGIKNEITEILSRALRGFWNDLSWLAAHLPQGIVEQEVQFEKQEGTAHEKMALEKAKLEIERIESEYRRLI